VAIAAVATAVWLAAQRPRSLAVPGGSPSIAGAASPVGSALAASLATAQPSVTATMTPTDVVVDVAGKVRHPGLYRLPVGARIDDAVRRAGGPLRGVDLTSLNLAARVVDGQQIVVGVPTAAPPGGGGGPSAQPVGQVNLNSATLDQLEALPGVGPVLAQHIIDWRVVHGAFTTVDQLNDVPGIGEVKFADLHSLVTT
jgi:competence protein ComEA